MNYPLFSDEYFMNEALKEARQARDKSEIPVGAVIVADNQIIARGHNQTENLLDVTAHAEILCITAASNYLGAKFLTDCSLYVTLEPCLMCAGAIKWARPSRLVYGAADPREGFTHLGDRILHPATQLSGGILAESCEVILKKFFQDKREKPASDRSFQ